MIRLDMWLTLPSGGCIKAGSMVTADPDPVRGVLGGQFRYAPEYLDHYRSCPLDPFHLPLTADTLDADRPGAGVHGVFEDSLPDDWGRRLMIRRYKLGRGEQGVPNLLRLLGNKGLGALIYAEEGTPAIATTVATSRHLKELALLAEKFEKDPATVEDDEIFLLFQAGSSPKQLLYNFNYFSFFFSLFCKCFAFFEEIILSPVCFSIDFLACFAASPPF